MKKSSRKPPPQSDAVEAFVAACCVEQADESTSSGALHLAYVQYCESHELTPLGVSAFGRSLTRLGYPSVRKCKSRHREGLSLKHDGSPVPSDSETVTDGVTDDAVPKSPDLTVYDASGDPTPPPILSPQVRKWWSSVVEDYTDEDGKCLFEEVHLRMLTAAGRLWDRAIQAMVISEHDGPRYRNHLGNWVAHPMVDMERRCWIDFAKLCRELGIDAPAE